MFESEQQRLFKLADELFAGLEREIQGVVLVGRRSQRLPNTINALFPDVSGRQLLENCPQVMASTGSACHADNEDPSAVLTALGIPHDQALGAVRLSLGRGTTKEDIAAAVSSLAAAWRVTSQTKCRNDQVLPNRRKRSA
jgi:cysteine desulfurase